MMSNKILLPLLCVGMLGVAQAAVVVKPVPYEIDGEAFEGLLVYDDAVNTARPGLVMVPNWMGVTDTAVARAKTIAGDDYVVLVADVYGKDVRPKDKSEAGAQTRKVFADGGIAVRERAAAAVTALKAQASKVQSLPDPPNSQGREARLTRKAHNLEIAGSNPAPTT